MSSGRFASLLLLIVMVGLTPTWPASGQVAVEDEPSWMWPESRWRKIVELVRAGPRLVPESWSDGNKVAIALSFDFDTETLSLRSGITSPSRLSTGQYGARGGLPRVLTCSIVMTSRRHFSYRR